MIKNVLFDLDGTLLPMPSQEKFVEKYLAEACKKMAVYGYKPEAIINAIWNGMGVMVKNDGSKSNEDAFWELFSKENTEDVQKTKEYFNDFYATDFWRAKGTTDCSEFSNLIVKELRRKGYRLVLATNPVFPAIATLQRIIWAGLDESDFELITTYENSSFSKPNPMYYREIMDKLGLLPEETIMMGNDTKEDMVAQQMGMNVYLVVDNLIDKENLFNQFTKRGTLADLYEIVKTLPEI